MKKTFLGIALLALCLLLPSCASKLEGGGAYAPGTTAYTTNAAGEVATNFNATAESDKAFFIADAAFWTAYSAIDGAFTFERENRDALWKLSTDVKHGLDKIRPDAVLYRNQYIAARKAYMANPTPAGLNLLESILGKVQQLQAAAVAVLPK